MTSPTLHRFVSRPSIGRSSYGYEIAKGHATVIDALATIAWIDCWCPDAAQFVLMDAPAGLCVGNSARLVDAIVRSDFSSKLRLVCGAAVLADRPLVSRLAERGIGLLLDSVVDADLQQIARLGIVGIRLGHARLSATQLRRVAASAFELGLRSVASQVSTDAVACVLTGHGVDYVSTSSSGIKPVPTDSWFERRRPA